MSFFIFHINNYILESSGKCNENSGNLIAIQTWIATLLGFIGAVGAFLYRTLKDQAQNKAQHAREILAFETFNSQLEIELARITSQSLSEKEKNDAKEKFRKHADDCYEFLKDYLAESAYRRSAERLQATLRDVSDHVDNINSIEEREKVENSLRHGFTQMLELVKSNAP